MPEGVAELAGDGPVEVWVQATAPDATPLAPPETGSQSDDTDLRRWLALLDDAERAQADRFVFAADRRSYVAAHGLARLKLARRLDCPPQSLRFVGARGEKPQLRVNDTPVSTRFSLSHTRGMAAVAFSSSVDPGIDVERVGRDVDWDLVDNVLAPPERAWLATLPSHRRADGFVRLWTLKEAYVKATGRGLSQALDAFWFEPDAPRIHFGPGIFDYPACWRFRQWVPAGGFVLAVGWRDAEGECRHGPLAQPQ